jgi:hypothetical protein
LASYFFATYFVAAILLWLATLWLGKMWPGTKHALRVVVPILGKVFFMVYKLLTEVVFGEWAMENKLTYGKIFGFLQVQQGKYIPQGAPFC